MDSYTPALLAQGLKGMIGKGNRGAEVLEAMKKEKAVYFTAVGGAGALIADWITSCGVIAYEDLGAEAIHRIEVKDFQVVVANDAYGGDLFKEGIARYRKDLTIPPFYFKKIFFSLALKFSSGAAALLFPPQLRLFCAGLNIMA